MAGMRRCTDCKGRAGPCLYYVTERWRDYIVSSGGGRCQYPECVLYDKGNGYFVGYDDGIGHVLYTIPKEIYKKLNDTNTAVKITRWRWYLSAFPM